jgi:D-proline reductase (dithiol) PrdB
VSAIAFFLERAGIATTGISLVRENTASLRPPRFLWVSFPLGRPLGVPGEAAFQQRVIRAALDLLAEPSGPVLRDFPEEAPEHSADAGPAFCALPLPAPGPALDARGRLAAEVAALAPWFEQARRARGGRSVTGVSGLERAAQLDVLAAALVELPANAPGIRTLTLVLDDLKTFHADAASAMPGGARDWRGLQRWLWRETQLGASIRRLHDGYAQHEIVALRAVARGIAPRGAFADEPAAEAAQRSHVSKEAP